MIQKYRHSPRTPLVAEDWGRRTERKCTVAVIQIDRLLETCVRRGASDLHLAVGRPPTLRLHGHLRELQTKVLEPEDTVALMKSITPERIQQEYEEAGSGDFGFAYGEEARFRVAIFKQKGYCSLVLRRIPNTILTFEQIGLPKMAEQICRRPRGCFLVTGPTGSGKTTTLATMITSTRTSIGTSSRWKTRSSITTRIR